MSSFLISGAGRGIGLALVKALLSRRSTEVIFAGVRNVPGAQGLQNLAESDKRVVVLSLDMNSQESIKAAADAVAAHTRSLSVLVNNAGFAPDKTTPAISVPSSDFLNAFQTNTLGPILLTQAVLSMLEKSSDGGLVVNVSSLLGSTQLNPGRQIAYAVSKAGLNMATVIFNKQLKDNGVIIVAAHPGTVATDMRPDLKMPGAMPHNSAEESADGIIQNIVFASDRAALGGRFVAWDGKDMPW